MKALKYVDQPTGSPVSERTFPGVLPAVLRASLLGLFMQTTPALAQIILEPPVLSEQGSMGDAIANEARAVSADGRYVVFSSYATNLVAADTNGFRDVFLWDTTTNSVNLISRSMGGTQANGDSDSAVISADGEWIAFVSAASNLSTDSNGPVEDIFLFSRTSGQLSIVSRSTEGLQSTQPARNPDINANGRYVTFDTVGALAEGAGTLVGSIYRWDSWNRSTELISRTQAGTSPDGMSLDAQMSADGERIVFVSMATNLVSTPTVGKDSYLFDAGTGETTLLSLTASLEAGGGISYFPSISGDGSVVAFHTNATNLVPDDQADVTDIVLRDLATDTFELLSRSSTGAVADGHNTHPSLNYDGSRVAFRTDATNLVANDVNGFGDIVLVDRATATTTLVSASADGSSGNGNSWAPSISLQGDHIAFWSQASDLTSTGSTFGDIVLALPDTIGEPAVAFSAAVLPSSRSAQTGSPLTAFASVIGTGIAGNCSVTLGNSLNVALNYQPTDPLTNTAVGVPNQPFLLLPGVPQTLLLTLVPNEALAAEELNFDFSCTPGAAPVLLGTNTLLVTAEALQPPDVIALAATVDNNGIVSLPAGGGSGFFSVASVNVGAPGDFVVRPVVTGTALDGVSICETNPVSGDCLGVAGTSVIVGIAGGDTPTFAVFVSHSADVPFLPGVNRLLVRFEDAGGVVRGRTSVAVRSLGEP